jgi:hypothetical protein
MGLNREGRHTDASESCSSALGSFDKVSAGAAVSADGSGGRAVYCSRCGDSLSGAPPGVTTCPGWAAWKAHCYGDTLTEDEANGLLLFRGLCSLAVAIRRGLDELPEW